MNRHVQTIFCDDIRHEIGGMLSYIGVYSDKMLVSAFPAVLPKFCLALRVVSPITKPFQKLSIHVFKDDEEIAVGEINEHELASFIEAIDGLPEDKRKDRVQSFNALFAFSPFHLNAPCILRIRVKTDEEELRGVGLRIEHSESMVAPQA